MTGTLEIKTIGYCQYQILLDGVDISHSVEKVELVPGRFPVVHLTPLRIVLHPDAQHQFAVVPQVPTEKMLVAAAGPKLSEEDRQNLLREWDAMVVAHYRCDEKRND